MSFRLQKETQEAQRKRIEAGGETLDVGRRPAGAPELLSAAGTAWDARLEECRELADRARLFEQARAAEDRARAPGKGRMVPRNF